MTGYLSGGSLVLGVGIALCLGCDSAPSGGGGEAAARSAAGMRPRPEPAEAGDSQAAAAAQVPRDFEDVAAAQAALFEAYAANESAAFRAAESWLLERGPVALESLAAVAADEAADPVHRVAACRVLPRFGEAACPALQPLLASPVEQVQVNAIRGLASMASLPAEAAAGLLRLTGPGPQRIRKEAILAIGRLGPSARERCGPRLLAILNDEEEAAIVRDAAKRALEEVSPRRSFVDP